MILKTALNPIIVISIAWVAATSSTTAHGDSEGVPCYPLYQKTQTGTDQAVYPAQSDVAVTWCELNNWGAFVCQVGSAEFNTCNMDNGNDDQNACITLNPSAWNKPNCYDGLEGCTEYTKCTVDGGVNCIIDATNPNTCS